MNGVIAESHNPTDRQVVDDAIDLNCLWIDEIEPKRRLDFVAALQRSVDDFIAGRLAIRPDAVALFQLRELASELRKRYR